MKRTNPVANANALNREFAKLRVAQATQAKATDLARMESRKAGQNLGFPLIIPKVR